MRVLILHLTFHLPAIHSLKEKRSIVKSLLQRCKNKFNVSVAEVGKQDSHQWSEVGIVAVGNDSILLENIANRVLDFVEMNYDLHVTQQEIEIW